MSERFAPELEAEAERLLAAPPPDPDAGRRRDFTRSHVVYTVDDASTTEIDDGLSLERLPDGRTKVGAGRPPAGCLAAGAGLVVPGECGQGGGAAWPWPAQC